MSRGIESLVEKNVGLAEHRTQRHDDRVRATSHPHLPVITVSREPGAGGTTIGRAVAERLGFACWDKELLTRIAEESDAVESVLAHIDEKVTSSVDDYVRLLLVGDAYSQSTYRITLTKVVGSIALHGASVIVGRGGHLILGPTRALRVRVVCPFEERVRRLMVRDGVGEHEASKRVRDLDATIRTFIRHHFGQDIAEPRHYDLIVNTSVLDVVQATQLVVLAYELKFHQQVVTVAPPAHHETDSPRRLADTA